MQWQKPPPVPAPCLLSQIHGADRQGPGEFQPAGTSCNQRLRVQHPILSGFARRQGRFAVHCGLVSLQERDVIPHDREIRDLQFPFRQPVNDGLGFPDAAEVKIAESQIEVGRAEFRIDGVDKCEPAGYDRRRPPAGSATAGFLAIGDLARSAEVTGDACGIASCAALVCAEHW